MKVRDWVGIWAAGAVALGASAGCGEQGTPDASERLGTTSSALSTDQCAYFETNGTTTICHATNSTTNPYVLIRVSESACVNAHANHPRDFIDVSGGSCNGAACLPETAPCDATLPCCGNLTCTSGTCTCPSGQTFCDVTCVDLTSDPNNCGGCGAACATGAQCINGACTNPCVALDQCHLAGKPDPTTGTCSTPPAPDGTPCNDGNACTQTDACQAGTCTGANPVVCSASDPCHIAGTCDASSGQCSIPAAPDGTVCGSGQICSAGACVTTAVCAEIGQTCTETTACCDGLICIDPLSGNPATRGSCTVIVH
jgi:hypothetical protein